MRSVGGRNKELEKEKSGVKEENWRNDKRDKRMESRGRKVWKKEIERSL